jgi:hypothetical protein
MPGIPSIFWDHVCDWGDDCRERIKVLLKLRQKAEIKARQRGMSQWYNGKQLFFFDFHGDLAQELDGFSDGTSYLNG